MNSKVNSKKWLISGLTMGVALAAGNAAAVDVYLCAASTTVTMPDGAVIDVWGYAEDDNANLADDCGANPVQVPGPMLSVPPGDPNLNVHLKNNLPTETSLVISGQSSNMSPVFYPVGDPREGRVRSFTHETAPGATGIYSWADFKPGTYAYQSGTHVAVQVQMGLYGAASKDSAAGEAYPGITYDNQALLFYSEIDPVLHAAIADGSYGSGAPGAPSSTINYAPRYFMVNGAPFSAASLPIDVGAAGSRTLLRMVNMSLRTVIPNLLGEDLQVVAEDGSAYPQARSQYSVMLAAGKTKDAIMVADADGSYPLFDRRLNLTNDNTAPGGLLSYLQVGAADPNRPQAVADSYTATEDTPLNIAAAGVLGNDTGGLAPLTATLVSGTSQGSVALQADGSFAYTPPADYSGPASFSYTATDGSQVSNIATVSINVAPVNDAPVAVDDSYLGTLDTPIKEWGGAVLLNDSDVDGDLLETQLVTAPANGTLTLYKKGGFVYTPNAGFAGIDSFTYQATDGLLTSAAATVTLDYSPKANQAPTAADDYAVTAMNNSVKIWVLPNDSDPEGSLDKTSVTLVSGPGRVGNTASVPPKGNHIVFTPGAGFSGSDTVTYTVRDSQGAVSNVATVRIDVMGNQPPVAVDDTATTTMGTNVVIWVLANDSDVDGTIDNTSVTLVSGPTQPGNTAAVPAKGNRIVFRPAAGFTGTDSFSYTVRDDLGAISNTAVVTVTVNP